MKDRRRAHHSRSGTRIFPDRRNGWMDRRHHFVFTRILFIGVVDLWARFVS